MTRKLFVHGLLIDGNGGQPVEESAMLVEDHKIKAIGKAADFTSCEPDVEIIDCRGKILMPGLINGHVHIFMEPYTWDREKFMQEPLSLLCVEIIENLHKTLRSGVTYVRDLGGYQDLDLQFRDYIDEGKVLGPNMICARHPLTITGGHGRDFGLECDGATAFIRGVREQIRAGADVIKIMPTAGYSRPKMKVNHNIVADTIYMSPMEIKAACDEAHKMGKMVAAHCCGYTGVYHAVMNGVDTIEHGQFRDTTGAEIPQLIEEMVKRGTWLVPTLAAYFKEYERAESEQNYQSVIETFRLCHQAGVKIALGTDAGVPWVGHDKTAYEVEHMVLYGMNNMEALVASTKSVAEMMGIINEYGTLTAGKNADFLILGDNPLTNIKALYQNLQAVYKNGQLV